MIRFAIKSVFLLGVAVVIAGIVVLTRSSDPLYVVQEWISYQQYHRYDDLIVETARKYDADPMLVKAVVWRESGFDSGKSGSKGERGLMQVSEMAAAEWAKAEGVKKFSPNDLFAPKINVEAGTWYLVRALKRWSKQDDPVPFALAEYNAGLSQVRRWAGSSSFATTGAGLRATIDYPTTQRYVDRIQQRYEFYKKRGRM